MFTGYLEVGETLEQAAVREVFEESGIKVRLPGSRLRVHFAMV